MPAKILNSERGLLKAHTGSFLTLQKEMNHLFDNFISDPSWPLLTVAPDTTMNFSPNVDITETEKEYKIKAEIPGMDEDKIQLSVENNTLVIKGEKKEESEERTKRHYHTERSFGRFYRSIPFNSEVNGERVSAKYKKGVLSVVIAKSDKAISSKKRIQIK